MYTQCEHCKAIFEVSMREVTVASGKLRCGECNQVFDAMASLSTTMPEPFSAETAHQKQNTSSSDKEHSPTKQPSARTDLNENLQHRPQISKPSGIKENVKDIAEDINKTIERKWVKPIALSLAILLLAQVLYNNRQYFTHTPIHEPDKIKMLSNNVFAHPNEVGVLLISASMENQADHDQPYPVLEVSLTDSQSRLIALRRFKPSEYLEHYNNKMLLKVNKPTNLKLKIKDPGDDATRFQFKFM